MQKGAFDDVPPAFVAQLDAYPSGYVAGWPQLGWQHTFVETDREIFSLVILILLLI